MQILKNDTDYYFAIDCIALTVVVLMQEGKQQGLDWEQFRCRRYILGKTKDVPWKADLGNSYDHGVLFFILAAVLNMNFRNQVTIQRQYPRGVLAYFLQNPGAYKAKCHHRR